MTVNYTAMHCNTLHYTAECTETHCSSDRETSPNNVAAMWSDYCPQNTLQQKITAGNKCKCKIMQICKTHCMAKPNVPEMQNPNRANATEVPSLMATWRHCYSLKLWHYKKCWLIKNGSIRLVKNKSETSANTYKTWWLKVKACECYIYFWLLGSNALNGLSKLGNFVWMFQNTV